MGNSAQGHVRKLKSLWADFSVEELKGTKDGLAENMLMFGPQGWPISHSSQFFTYYMRTEKFDSWMQTENQVPYCPANVAKS
jgi:hypothetical protein